MGFWMKVLGFLGRTQRPKKRARRRRMWPARESVMKGHRRGRWACRRLLYTWVAMQTLRVSVGQGGLLGAYVECCVGP